MKKKIALLSLLGAAGGLLYALESQHKRNRTANADKEDNNEAVAGNGRSANAKQDGSRQAEPAASMARIENSEAPFGNEAEHVIDDQGTGQSEASQILKHIRDNAFEANDEKLALALGRPTEEIEEWTSGRGLIDGDVILNMHLIQLLLPLHDNEGRPFSVNHFTQVRRDLTDCFGGVTAFIRAPAVGLWKESADDINHDQVVMFEVLAEELDRDWWSLYRKQLQNKFRQDEVLIWASNITKL